MESAMAGFGLFKGHFQGFALVVNSEEIVVAALNILSFVPHYKSLSRMWWKSKFVGLSLLHIFWINWIEILYLLFIK